MVYYSMTLLACSAIVTVFVAAIDKKPLVSSGDSSSLIEIQSHSSDFMPSVYLNLTDGPRAGGSTETRAKVPGSDLSDELWLRRKSDPESPNPYENPAMKVLENDCQ